MASKYWIKLYHEMLDDPKIGKMPDRLCWRMVQLFLVAGELDMAGLLLTTEDLSWRLRMEQTKLEADLLALQKFEIISQEEGLWKVRNFEKRQGPMSAAERKRRQREAERRKKEALSRNVTDDVTKPSRNVTDDVSRSVTKDDINGNNIQENECHEMSRVDKIRIDKIREEENHARAHAHARGQQIEDHEKPMSRSVTDDVTEVSRSVTPAAPAAPASKGDIIRILASATGMMAIPPKEYDRIEQIWTLIDQFGNEKVEDAIRVAFQKWINTRSKDGRFYKRTNLGFIDWAQEILHGGSLESGKESFLDQLKRGD